jgi:hypothetical protein
VCIQSFTDGHFYRSRYDARKVLESFSAKLCDETDLDAVRNDLVGEVRERDTVRPRLAMAAPRNDLKGWA